MAFKGEQEQMWDRTRGGFTAAEVPDLAAVEFSMWRAPSVGHGVARCRSITFRLASANSLDNSSAVGVSSEVRTCTRARGL